MSQYCYIFIYKLIPFLRLEQFYILKNLSVLLGKIFVLMFEVAEKDNLILTKLEFANINSLLNRLNRKL